MTKISIVGVTLLLLAACHRPEIEGHWVQPIPGMENQVQGMFLQEGGKASSINMSTLVYENWRKEGDKLVLNGKSIGNGQTIDFSQEYEISKLTDTELVLKDGQMEQVFWRTMDDK